MAGDPFVLVGLGNPGPEYAPTRHNAGFMVIDEIARRHGLTVKDRSRTALTGEGLAEGRALVLVKPRTYMNLSGNAVVSLRARLRFPLERMLVIVDDFALPLGKLRLRPRGSPGGHNGLASISSTLGTDEYPRLRLGVGPVPAGLDPADYVLSPFADRERQEVEAMVERAADCAEAWWTGGIDAAMNEFNRA